MANSNEPQIGNVVVREEVDVNRRRSERYQRPQRGMMS